MVELNRSVAVMMNEGPDAGSAVPEKLERDGSLSGNHLRPALRGDFHRRAARGAGAEAHFGKALALARSAPAWHFLSEQLRAIDVV